MRKKCDIGKWCDVNQQKTITHHDIYFFAWQI